MKAASMTNRIRSRQEKSVAAYSGAHEALIAEPSRGTPLPFRATSLSRKFPLSHSRVSDIPQRDACILSASLHAPQLVKRSRRRYRSVRGKLQNAVIGAVRRFA